MCSDLSILSKYRSELMGIAMLLVMYSHIPVPFSFWPLCVTQWNGHFGVDMFLVLSGMGLVYSIRKNNSYVVFYEKRAIRIFPIYTLLNLLYLIKPVFFHGERVDILNVVSTCTTIGYWFDYGYCDWFIPHIVVMYILFPIIWNFIRKIDSRYCLLLVFFLWLLLNVTNVEDANFYRASYRYIDFVLGIIVGKLIIESKHDSQKLSILFVVMLLIGTFIALYYHINYAKEVGFWFNNQAFFQNGYVYIPYPLGVVGVMIVVGLLFSWLSGHVRLKLISWCGRSLRLIGDMSIELYLLHIWILHTYFYPNVVGLVCFLLTSFGLAYLFHYMNKKIMNYLLLRFVKT